MAVAEPPAAIPAPAAPERRRQRPRPPASAAPSCSSNARVLCPRRGVLLGGGATPPLQPAPSPVAGPVVRPCLPHPHLGKLTALATHRGTGLPSLHCASARDCSVGTCLHGQGEAVCGGERCPPRSSPFQQPSAGLPAEGQGATQLGVVRGVLQWRRSHTGPLPSCGFSSRS